MKPIRVIDSHSGGEPTRVVLEGGPELGSGSLAERLEIFRENFDEIRSAIVCEPRGSEGLVGALLCEPVDSTCEAGVIYFNNVGYLGMCGSGTIGLVATLAHLGRISTGEHAIETPVGIVQTQWHGNGRVSFQNIPAYRYRAAVAVEVPGIGKLQGDIAWGGNWFFMIEEHGQQVAQANIESLTQCAKTVRKALDEARITGENRQEIDHIVFYGPPTVQGADSKNFVLCPGGAYDRCPCGTSTSARLACLFADNKISPGETFRQEGILGSIFEGMLLLDKKNQDDKHKRIVPTITGEAYITAESVLHFNSHDPFQTGIRL